MPPTDESLPIHDAPPEPPLNHAVFVGLLAVAMIGFWGGLAWILVKVIL